MSYVTYFVHKTMARVIAPGISNKATNGHPHTARARPANGRRPHLSSMAIRSCAVWSGWVTCPSYLGGLWLVWALVMYSRAQSGAEVQCDYVRVVLIYIYISIYTTAIILDVSNTILDVTNTIGLLDVTNTILDVTNTIVVRRCLKMAQLFHIFPWNSSETDALNINTLNVPKNVFM